jgi:hypothetical protein
MSSHLSEEDLVLLHYGELQDPATAQAHLLGCAECRGAAEALGRVLAAVGEGDVPERGPEYGRAVWARVRPRLAESRRPARVLPFVRRLVPVGAIAASLLIAFLLGRASHEREDRIAQPIPEQARERILLVAVGEHLERSQMVLIELQNAGGNGTVDISSERRWAEELVPANRLYRQAALRAGERGVASVLDDLERVLLEVAMSPDQLSSGALDEIRRRIEAQGILFKVRVIGTQVREREHLGERRLATSS